MSVIHTVCMVSRRRCGEERIGSRSFLIFQSRPTAHPCRRANDATSRHASDDATSNDRRYGAYGHAAHDATAYGPGAADGYVVYSKRSKEIIPLIHRVSKNKNLFARPIFSARIATVILSICKDWATNVDREL